MQVGDVVLTSGLGGSYTRGLIIGTVVRVEGSAGSDTRKIVVAPNDTVSLMEEALVVFSAADDAADRTVTAPTSADGGEGRPAPTRGDGDGDDTGGGDDAGQRATAPATMRAAPTAPKEARPHDGTFPRDGGGRHRRRPSPCFCR